MAQQGAEQEGPDQRISGSVNQRISESVDQ
jgi:hypothetical protein